MTYSYRPAMRAVLLLVMLVPAPRAALAQDPGGDADRPPMTIGPFELWPTIVLRGIGMDANVYNEAENPKRDFTATIAPALRVIVKPPRIRLSSTTSSDLVYFRKYTDQRHVNRNVSAAAEVDLTYIRPFASISVADARERPNAEIDLRARVRDRTYSGGVRVPLGPVASFSVAARRGTTRYAGGQQFRGVELASELNDETNAIDASFSLAITPLTTIGLAATKEEDRFEHSPLRHSDSVRIAPTISFAPAGYFSGSASVGWRRFDALDPAVADYSGLTANGTVGIVIVDRYHVETTFGRDVRYSYDAVTPTYIWTSGRGTLRMDLFGGVDVKLMAGRDVMAYRPVEAVEIRGRDTVVNYGLGLGYNVRDNIRIGVDADFIERKSAQAPRGYTNNRVFGTLVWGVRQP